MFVHKVTFGDGFVARVPRAAAVHALAFSERMSTESAGQLLDRMEAAVLADPDGPALFVGTGERSLEVWLVG